MALLHYEVERVRALGTWVMWISFWTNYVVWRGTWLGPEGLIRGRVVDMSAGRAAVAGRRSVLAAVCLAVVVAGCGGTAMSLTEYTERMNAMEQRATQRAEQLVAEAESATDFTPQGLQTVLEQAGLIRVEIKEAADAIDPPDQVADLHNLIFDGHTHFISVEENLAVRAGGAEDTEADWAALSNSPEMAAYRDAIAQGKTICEEFQGKLDATAARGAFADTPWIPAEMQEVVEAVLGCAWFPERPEDVYRYPPPNP